MRKKAIFTSHSQDWRTPQRLFDEPDKEFRSKYGNRWTVVDGIKFQSLREAKRYRELKLMEKAGEISTPILQPVFKFEIKDEVIFKYVADFFYFDQRKNKYVTEDVKGFKTPLYRLKKKLIEAEYEIKIIEI